MLAQRTTLFLLLAFPMFTCTIRAEEPTRVSAADLHVDKLRSGRSTYLVYMHAGQGSGIKNPMLASTEISQQQVDGNDAWVIEHTWEAEGGVVHTARSIHAPIDLATVAQTTHWNWGDRRYSTDVRPMLGTGSIDGELPAAARARTEAGFGQMKSGWWLNWHSDLALLPLLPFERGGTLRIRLFDVGMEAPSDVDYKVLGTRTLHSARGEPRVCWLVETESGRPGSGYFQRFWIDKERRVVLKEEDVIGQSYRSKLLLAVPATVEFAVPRAQNQSTPAH